MSGKLKKYLAISWGWAAVVGLGLFVADVSLDSLTGILIMAVLYMPSPFIAALIAERGLVKNRLRLPRRGIRPWLIFLLAPVVAVITFVLLFMAVVFIGGNVLGLPAFGSLSTTSTAITAGAAELLGQAAVDAAGPPPPLPVLMLASVWGAVLAGWTINGLFAFGEEYGWRGLMWDELKDHGAVRANLVIGPAWGLWHAPVILQGYNYPGHSVLGVLAMVVFCTGMSSMLTALRELTSSVWPVAAAHGIFNALAPILLVVAPHTSPVLTGPLGVLGAVLFLLLGAGFWSAVRHRRRELTAVSA